MILTEIIDGKLRKDRFKFGRRQLGLFSASEMLDDCSVEVYFV